MKQSRHNLSYCRNTKGPIYSPTSCICHLPRYHILLDGNREKQETAILTGAGRAWLSYLKVGREDVRVSSSPFALPIWTVLSGVRRMLMGNTRTISTSDEITSRMGLSTTRLMSGRKFTPNFSKRGTDRS
jgi:hypothetical protein